MLGLYHLCGGSYSFSSVALVDLNPGIFFKKV